MLFFCLFQYIEEKEYQTESKWNETFGSVIFGTNVVRRTWSASQEAIEEATRVEGTPPYRARPLSRGPLRHPPTYFFLQYIPIYPKHIEEQNRSGVPPPEASVATENQSRLVPAPCRRGESLSGGHLHHPGALHDEEGVVLLWG